MSVTRHVMQYGRARVTRKLLRSMPWLGAVVAVATLGAAIRRKGAIAGALDTALDAIPGVGAAKNLAEAWRGRDFIPDRPASSPSVTSLRHR